MSNLTCETCRHWKRGPIDPTNLAAPRLGFCTEHLRVIAFPKMGPGGVNITVQPMYPQVSATFLACGRHEAAREPLGCDNGQGALAPGTMDQSSS